MTALQLPRSAAIALIGLVATAAIGLLMSTGTAGLWRERILDELLARPAVAPRPSSPVIVVDIDRAALGDIAPWPWSREQMAALVEVIADARPKAVGLDILLAGEDERSARTLAKRLATASPDPEIKGLAMSLAERLPDGDARLAAALARVPAVLGLVLDPEPDQDAPGPATVLFRGKPDLARIWQEEGVAGTTGAPARAAAGHGVLLLPGDPDASLRRAPLLVATRSGLYPGLAVEVARVAADASTYLVEADPLALRAGRLSLPAGPDLMLRLRPRPDGAHAARTLPASRLLLEPSLRQRLGGAVVLIGSSAPEAGGLRPAAFGRLVASVQLQADAVEQILVGDVPRRPLGLWLAELAALAAAALAAALAAARLSPVRAGTVALAVAGCWALLSLIAIQRWGVLIDPLGVPLAAIAGFALALLATATATRHREALIRRRFEQHLAPAVVERIVQNPGLLRLQGEARVVTALFSDIEGFTAMTERAEPADLVALLDRYIEGSSRIVVEHGGMVEKIVGDSVHAIFNVPLDLPDHPRRALACAQALVAFTEALRQEPAGRRLALGRTRIGIETGPVIVGDVGGGRKLDYTAHGNAMNRAARLEAANKELGSAIAIGPIAAAEIGEEALMPLGEIALRGVSETIMAYGPWPAGFDAAARSRFRQAMARAGTHPLESEAVFRALHAEHPGNRVLARLAGSQPAERN